MSELEGILGIKFPKGIKISDVTNNSKKVKENSIFFALEGEKEHGSKYISEALELGASIVVHNDPKYKTDRANVFFIDDLNKRTKLENTFHTGPDFELIPAYSRDIKIYQFLQVFYSIEKDVSLGLDFHSSAGTEFLGFTGTNGKTTSAYFCHQILTNLGANSVYIGTLGFKFRDEEFNNSVTSKTTPDIFEIYEIFTLIKSQVQYVCIELSSHALEQERLKIPFTNVSLMNIGNDHLDYHKSIDSYAEAKLKIFDLTRNYFSSFISKEHRPNVPKKLKDDFNNGYIYEDFSTLDADNHECRCLINIDSFLPNNIKKKIYMPIDNHIADYEELKKMPSLLDLPANEKDIVIKEYKLKRDKIIKKWKFPLQVLEREDENNLYPVTTISKQNPNANYFYKIVEKDINHSKLQIIDNNKDMWKAGNHKKITYDFTCNIFPEFNITNLVFSLVSIIQLMKIRQSVTWGDSNAGRDLAYDSWYPHRHAIGSKIPNDLNFIKLPKGRTDLIKDIKQNVIIDYAHNPDSLSLLLISMKDYFKKLIVVFGCGGDRDKSKRSKMLKVAINHASKIIFTSDNSRSETFEDIFKDASSGNNLNNVKVVEDRKEAIIYGSKLIDDDDCLLILGKGHEETQEIDGEIMYFSDYEVVNEIYS